MTTPEILARLEQLGSEKIRSIKSRAEAGANQYGVALGDLRTLAKAIKPDHALALELWGTGNADAMLLAILLMRPKQLTPEELEAMAASVGSTQIADWFTAYVIKLSPHKEALRQRWMQSADSMLARAGWSLTAERISKNPDGLDLSGLLDRIERELASTPAPAQWTMNYALAAIGIDFPEHRDRALEIGERLGVYRDYPTPKGCTSPFAPLWIREMVGRNA